MTSAAQDMTNNLKSAALSVTIFVGIEVAVGFVGNLFVLYVFLFRYHTCNFRYFVLCLSFLDFISTLTTMPGEIFSQQNWYTYPFPDICKAKSFFNVYTVTGEAVCLCIIAIDRYRKVCQPFGWQIRPRLALLLCGFIHIAAVAMAVPVSILWGVNSHPEKYNKTTSVNVTVCEKDQEFLQKDNPFEYVTTVEVVVFICLVIMFFLYIFVAKTLILGKNRFQQRTGSQTGIGSNAQVLCTEKELSSDRAQSEDGYCSTSDERKKTDPNGILDREQPQNLSANSCDLSSEVVIEVEDMNVVTTNRGDPGQVSEKASTQIAAAIVHQREDKVRRVRRKTLIMLILTIVFIITAILYLTLLALISRSNDILQNMDYQGKAVYFFFFRLVFINHVINPIVYGCLDEQFKKVMSGVKQSVVTLLKCG
ncbi:uncharacterized protein LOC127857206 [Dreissena polymorpha]|uniref:G-protein coupled receptors family 1 profile domain-containing protein n=1 Tax=Dreissena polymorpha TaxID=45954 RepID=A0A9D3YXQ8_DREPO|nr:uncharacterized protein LOC127857206 [Dreissena polymorpha]KAH3707874.1 hypothetical protein DPMN_067293 [Dreissena polymorpha]